MNLTTAVQGALLVAIVLGITSYIMYTIGLYKVFKHLDRPAGRAFVPVLNYYSQIRAVRAPRKWFFLSLLPYIGVVYAGSVAIRLGAVFGKEPSFSLFWLTFGAFVGMPIIARSTPVHPELLDKPLRLIDVRALRKKLKDKKKLRESKEEAATI